MEGSGRGLFEIICAYMRGESEERMRFEMSSYSMLSIGCYLYTNPLSMKLVKDKIGSNSFEEVCFQPIYYSHREPCCHANSFRQLGCIYI
jgi:hypothetical protein